MDKFQLALMEKTLLDFTTRPSSESLEAFAKHFLKIEIYVSYPRDSYKKSPSPLAKKLYHKIALSQQERQGATREFISHLAVMSW